MSESRGPDPELDALKFRLRRFAAERDWDQFHSPKNLAIALIVDAAVSCVVEGKRPKEFQSRHWVARQKKAINQSLDALENAIPELDGR